MHIINGFYHQHSRKASSGYFRERLFPSFVCLLTHSRLNSSVDDHVKGRRVGRLVAEQKSHTVQDLLHRSQALQGNAIDLVLANLFRIGRVVRRANFFGVQAILTFPERSRTNQGRAGRLTRERREEAGRGEVRRSCARCGTCRQTVQRTCKLLNSMRGRAAHFWFAFFNCKEIRPLT